MSNTTTITIRVTEECIAEGRPSMCKSCPVALAAQRAGLMGASVDTDAMWINHEPFMLPRSAQRFMKAFDAGKPVKPFAFRVRRPQ